jgi:hypothetical protein
MEDYLPRQTTTTKHNTTHTIGKMSSKTLSKQGSDPDNHEDKMEE